jgi:hypothetical protein
MGRVLHYLLFKRGNLHSAYLIKKATWCHFRGNPAKSLLEKVVLGKKTVWNVSAGQIDANAVLTHGDAKCWEGGVAVTEEGENDPMRSWICLCADECPAATKAIRIKLHANPDAWAFFGYKAADRTVG